MLVCKICNRIKISDDFWPGNRSTCKPCYQERNTRQYIVRQGVYGSKAWSNRKRSHLKRRAANKDLPFDLTISNVQDLYTAKICGYCRRPKPEVVISFDRMVPELGYVFSNAFMCCSDCNTLRSNKLTHEEMLEIGKVLRRIYKNRLAP